MVAIPVVSGTTATVPVNTTLSPALAISTTSFRQITSIVRGMEPDSMVSETKEVAANEEKGFFNQRKESIRDSWTMMRVY